MQDDIKKPAKQVATTPAVDVDQKASKKIGNEPEKHQLPAESTVKTEAEQEQVEKAPKPEKQHKTKGADLVITIAALVCLALVGVAVYIQL